MNTETKATELEYSSEMTEIFYAEELEDRFEMAGAVAAPNGVCWHVLD